MTKREYYEGFRRAKADEHRIEMLKQKEQLSEDGVLSREEAAILKRTRPLGAGGQISNQGKIGLGHVDRLQQDVRFSKKGKSDIG